MSTKRTGNISVQTADIFPIIKKWLYSEHDIFLRELVSNATDAITKRAAAARTRNEEIPVGRIRVAVSPKARTITIEDNGIGMTEEEVEKYIARLAFSGAEEFVEKMKEAGEGADIIGKFGLGFYSAFMVADKVEIDTLSMEADSKAVKWTCQGDPEYVFEEGERTEVGTTVVLHVGKEGEEFLGEYKVSGTLRKLLRLYALRDIRRRYGEEGQAHQGRRQRRRGGRRGRPPSPPSSTRPSRCGKKTPRNSRTRTTGISSASSSPSSRRPCFGSTSRSTTPSASKASSTFRRSTP